MSCGFANITGDGSGTIASQMAGFFAVKTNDGMTGVGKMRSRMTKAARFRLSNITKLNKFFSKAHIAGDGFFHPNTIVTAPILNIFPSRVAKKTTSVGDNFTVICEALNYR